VQGFLRLSVVFLSLLAETIALYYNFFNSLYSFQQTLNSTESERKNPGWILRIQPGFPFSFTLACPVKYIEDMKGSEFNRGLPRHLVGSKL